MTKEIGIDGDSLTLEDFGAVVNNNRNVKLGIRGVKNVEKAHKSVLDILSSQKVVYGINTGFGALSKAHIPPDKVKMLQLNLVRSHSAGTGDPLPEEAVKGMMLLLANSLAKGYSGCRRIIVDTLIKMINKHVIPMVPAQGSLGASGDLIPLAHCALVMIGEGEAFYKRKRMSGLRAMRSAGIPTLTLEAKEGLSLVNGTYAMGSLGAISLLRSEKLIRLADIASAMTLEVTMGSKAPMSPEIHRARPHKGQINTAENILKLVEGSEIIRSHIDCDRVQDAYSIRCIPQAHCAVRDALEYCRNILRVEINSASDNPLVFSNDVLSAGNFHGQPLAVPLDTLGIAITGLGNISERRIDRLMNPVSSGLPPFLAQDPGLNSGYMMASYLAAALALENRGLASPGSVGTVPVSANKEDYISNGMWSARKALTIVENSERIVAVELLCGAQALDFIDNMKPGKGVNAAYKAIRTAVPPLKRDRIIKKDIAAVIGLMKNNTIIESVETSAGSLI
ncbi:histidine ammonia-lyase [candidate division KSB1 bacterium]